jgi:hypothetical protein
VAKAAKAASVGTAARPVRAIAEAWPNETRTKTSEERRRFSQAHSQLSNDAGARRRPRETGRRARSATVAPGVLRLNFGQKRCDLTQSKQNDRVVVKLGRNPDVLPRGLRQLHQNRKSRSLFKNNCRETSGAVEPKMANSALSLK